MDFHNVLIQTIESLARKGFVFSNESQFQFNLAWELQSRGYQVMFEVLASPCAQFEDFSASTAKKAYIDLVVMGNNGECYAIELKYKTPQRNHTYHTELGVFHTFSQGAPDLGAFLFWKDVERLELLGTEDLVLNFRRDIPITRKYAILLTNDHIYWDGSNNSLCREFFPTEGKEVRSPLCWHILLDADTRARVSGRQTRNITDFRVETDADAQTYCLLNDKRKPVDPILIRNAYKCQWQPYPCEVGDSPIFRFLILEIP